MSGRMNRCLSTLAICCWRAGVDGDGRFVVGANYVSPVTPQKQSEHHGVIWQSGMGSGRAMIK